MEDVPAPEPAEATPDAPEETPQEVPAPAQTETPEPAKGKKGEKVSPWKLVDTYKGKVAELEKKLSEKSGMSEQEKKEYQDKLEAITKRNQELEDEIRFTNYTKHPEFKSKYDEPYQKAWAAAVQEMSELTIVDDTGRERQVTAQDILEMVNMPLKKAREYANNKFGDFADDAMAHRKEIQRLFAAREQALKDAKAYSAEREKAKMEAESKKTSETMEFIKQTFSQANEEALKLPEVGKFFTPAEGDEAGNAQLQKGFALVDQGFSEFAKLNDDSTPREEKVKIVKRLVAIRNRAAAFGRLVGMVAREMKEKKALQDELKQFKGSEPPSAPSAAARGGEPAPANVREQVFSKLRKLAH